MALSWRALGGSGRCNLAVIPQEWRESVEGTATNRLNCLPLCNDTSIMLPERCVVHVWFYVGFVWSDFVLAQFSLNLAMALAANAGRFIGVVFSLLFWAWI